MQKNDRIAERFERFFWDASSDSISILQHERYIIERLLNEGDLQSLKWLM
jgi:hypothetical protein